MPHRAHGYISTCPSKPNAFKCITSPELPCNAEPPRSFREIPGQVSRRGLPVMIGGRTQVVGLQTYGYSSGYRPLGLEVFLSCGTREAGYLKVGCEVCAASASASLRDSRSRKVAFWFVRQSSGVCLAACENPVVRWMDTEQEQKSSLLGLILILRLE